jgi:hypothetical protein
MKNKIKYFIIPYIAIGCVLSLVIGIEYNFEGQDVFPTYYGSPFIFKQKSLASSMEFFYSISGLVLNTLVWSIFFFLIDKFIKNIIEKISNPKLINIIYKIIIGLMIVFATLNIAIDSIMIGQGFEKGLNYWYWNVDEEAKAWGMICKRKNILFEK